MTHRFTNQILLAAVAGTLLFAASGPAAAQRAKPKAPPQPAPRNYAFDAAASEITVILTQEGLMSRRYPTHRVVAKSFNGSVDLPKDETGMSVAVEAEAKMLTNADAAMSEFERKEFHSVLRNAVLEADKFPRIKFASVSVGGLQRDGDKRSFTVSGDLTLHGVTKRVTFPVNATIGEKELRATGEAKLKQSDFGMKPFEKGLGLIKIGDEVKVSFTVIARAQ